LQDTGRDSFRVRQELLRPCVRHPFHATRILLGDDSETDPSGRPAVRHFWGWAL